MISVKKLFSYIILASASLLTLASCSAMTEEEPDCNPYYKVRFRFDMNMLFADAFSTQVGEVDLYVFDKDENLVWKGHEEGEPLAQEGYLMDLPVPPGDYHLIAWCHKRHENAAGFDLSGGDNPTHFTDHFKMKMQRAYDDTQAHSTTDLHALFHGKVSVNLSDNLSATDDKGAPVFKQVNGQYVQVVTVPLIKDTNSIRIQLVHLSGKEIKSSDFDFKITDNNGHLAHDNVILDDEDIEYRPWIKREGVAGTVLPIINSGANGITPIPDEGVYHPSTAAPVVHSITAELTTSRLQTCQNPILTVIRKSDNTPVANINILDYFLMVKGEYHRPMDDDEYFDRQDEYNMTLFMHDDGTWYQAVIDILKWRVVRQSADL